jgi:hypothetical protein
VDELVRAIVVNGGIEQFLGAFFATVFSLAALGLVTLVGAITARKTRHYNGLINLEIRLNRHIDQLYSIIYSIDGLRKANQKRGVSFNTIDSIKIESIEEYESLLDLTLRNQLFSYNSGVERINSDLSNVGSIYSELRTSFIAKQLTPEEFFDAFPDLVGNLQILKTGLKVQIDEAVFLAAEVRLMIKRDRGIFIRAKLWLSSLGMKPLKKAAIDKEKSVLLSEIEMSKEESRKHLDRLFKK